MKLLSVTMFLLLAGCTTILGINPFYKNGKEPFIKEDPVYPLGLIDSDKIIRIYNPLDIEISVTVDCNKLNIYMFNVKPHTYIWFKSSVENTKINSNIYQISSWDIT